MAWERDEVYPVNVTEYLRQIELLAARFDNLEAAAGSVAMHPNALYALKSRFLRSIAPQIRESTARRLAKLFYGNADEFMRLTMTSTYGLRSEEVKHG